MGMLFDVLSYPSTTIIFNLTVWEHLSQDLPWGILGEMGGHVTTVLLGPTVVENSTEVIANRGFAGMDNYIPPVECKRLGSRCP